VDAMIKLRRVKISVILQNYSNMLQILKSLPFVTTAQIFCIRYYGKIMAYFFFNYFILNYYSFWTIDKSIYFEKLTRYNGSMFRTIHATIEIPTTPRKLVAYLQELPKILAWKEAVVNYAIQFK
jgi:hypothetical protein